MSEPSPPLRRRGSYVPIDFTPAIEKQCLKQVEFYFSQFNYPYDKFLRTTAEKNDGWVPITTIATFNRMKKFRPVDKVVEALHKSQVLQVSEDGENVKRRVPLDEATDVKREHWKRTVAVMNFPTELKQSDEASSEEHKEEEEDEKAELQESIEQFFHKLASVNQVRLRRDHRKGFNGTVLVEFVSEEEASKFTDEYSKEVLSYQGRKLNVLTKKQYDLQREATRSKNFSGSGQRSRSFTGHRKNMPVNLKKFRKRAKKAENENALDDGEGGSKESTV